MAAQPLSNGTMKIVLTKKTCLAGAAASKATVTRWTLLIPVPILGPGNSNSICFIRRLSAYRYLFQNVFLTIDTPRYTNTAVITEVSPSYYYSCSTSLLYTKFSTAVLVAEVLNLVFIYAPDAAVPLSREVHVPASACGLTLFIIFDGTRVLITAPAAPPVPKR